MNRRKLLRGVGAISLVSVSGCSESDNSEEETPIPEQQNNSSSTEKQGNVTNEDKNSTKQDSTEKSNKTGIISEVVETTGSPDISKVIKITNYADNDKKLIFIHNSNTNIPVWDLGSGQTKFYTLETEDITNNISHIVNWPDGFNYTPDQTVQVNNEYTYAVSSEFPSPDGINKNDIAEAQIVDSQGPYVDNQFSQSRLNNKLEYTGNSRGYPPLHGSYWERIHTIRVASVTKEQTYTVQFEQPQLELQDASVEMNQEGAKINIKYILNNGFVHPLKSLIINKQGTPWAADSNTNFSKDTASARVNKNGEYIAENSIVGGGVMSEGETKPGEHTDSMEFSSDDLNYPLSDSAAIRIIIFAGHTPLAEERIELV
ncbi:hypothetical protein [Halalkalirubrum salinum]|uniref:hypothetical protein n=1 Tax=Halalkalirubrum salinum TaxID=2563889 RepID=UPI0010FB4295|nr:hypothetical protein [Halalkalirubrum salinum]